MEQNAETIIISDSDDIEEGEIICDSDEDWGKETISKKFSWSDLSVLMVGDERILSLCWTSLTGFPKQELFYITGGNTKEICSLIDRQITEKHDIVIIVGFHYDLCFYEFGNGRQMKIRHGTDFISITDTIKEYSAKWRIKYPKKYFVFAMPYPVDFYCHDQNLKLSNELFHEKEQINLTELYYSRVEILFGAIKKINMCEIYIFNVNKLPCFKHIFYNLSEYLTNGIFPTKDISQVFAYYFVEYLCKTVFTSENKCNIDLKVANSELLSLRTNYYSYLEEQFDLIPEISAYSVWDDDMSQSNNKTSLLEISTDSYSPTSIESVLPVSISLSSSSSLDNVPSVREARKSKPTYVNFDKCKSLIKGTNKESTCDMIRKRSKHRTSSPLCKCGSESTSLKYRFDSKKSRKPSCPSRTSNSPTYSKRSKYEEVQIHISKTTSSRKRHGSRSSRRSPKKISRSRSNSSGRLSKKICKSRSNSSERSPKENSKSRSNSSGRSSKNSKSRSNSYGESSKFRSNSSERLSRRSYQSRSRSPTIISKVIHISRHRSRKHNRRSSLRRSRSPNRRIHSCLLENRKSVSSNESSKVVRKKSSKSRPIKDKYSIGSPLQNTDDILKMAEIVDVKVNKAHSLSIGETSVTTNTKRELDQVKLTEKNEEIQFWKALKRLKEVHELECEAFRKTPISHPSYARENIKFFDNYIAKTAESKPWDEFWMMRMEELFQEKWNDSKIQLSLACSKIGNKAIVEQPGCTSPLQLPDSTVDSNDLLKTKSNIVKSKESEESFSECDLNEDSLGIDMSMCRNRIDEEMDIDLIMNDPMFKQGLDDIDLAIKKVFKNEISDKHSDFSNDEKTNDKLVQSSPLFPYATSSKEFENIRQSNVDLKLIYPKNNDRHNCEKKNMNIHFLYIMKMLTRLTKQLGPLGVSISEIYANAKTNYDSSNNALVALDSDAKIVLDLVGNKIKNLLKNEISTVQRAVYCEVLERTRFFLNELTLHSTKFPKVDMKNIATTIKERDVVSAIEFIKSTLLYYGYFDFTSHDLMDIYQAVQHC